MKDFLYYLLKTFYVFLDVIFATAEMLLLVLPLYLGSVYSPWYFPLWFAEIPIAALMVFLNEEVFWD